MEKKNKNGNAKRQLVVPTLKTVIYKSHGKKASFDFLQSNFVPGLPVQLFLVTMSHQSQTDDQGVADAQHV